MIALVILPLVVALVSPLQTGREAIWVIGALAGVLALSLLVIQVLLPTPWLRGIIIGDDSRVHRLLGIAIAVIVIVHVGGLYVTSPDDIADALVLQAPTYSRLGVLSAWCLALSLGLALARRKLALTYSDWQIVHAFLAVVVVTTAVAHTVMIRGTLDGPVEVLLCGAAVIAVSAAIVHRFVLLPLQRRARLGRSVVAGGPESSASTTPQSNW